MFYNETANKQSKWEYQANFHAFRQNFISKECGTKRGNFLSTHMFEGFTCFWVKYLAIYGPTTQVPNLIKKYIQQK